MAPPSGIEVTLELHKEVFSSGEPINMSLHVRNAGSVPVTYSYGGYSYDFFVDGPEGVVWIWVQSFVASPGAFEGFLRQGSLDPGETVTMSETWRQENCRDRAQSLPPGVYSARGAFVVIQNPNDASSQRNVGWWSDPVQFEIR